MVHLSRLAEDIILYATSEFGFVELSDAVSTGSSLMPQKKNPDSMELVRGKSGRVVGHLTGLLVMLKGLPLAYDKDMQEDKEALFDATDTVRACLNVTSTVLQNMRLNEAVARQAASHGYLNATELADYLVRKGIPFREAHETVGRAVVRAIELGVELQELPLAELRTFSEVIGEDVYDALSLNSTINSKQQFGGTASERVCESLAAARSTLLS
jgi:argininosuccinate lyase